MILGLVITAIVLTLLSWREMIRAHAGPEVPLPGWVRWLDYLGMAFLLLFAMVIALQMIIVWTWG